MKKLFNANLSNNEVWFEVIEDVFTMVPGSYEYDVIFDEHIQSLHKRVVELTDECNKRITEVTITCYPNEDDENYIVEIEIYKN